MTSAEKTPVEPGLRAVSLEELRKIQLQLLDAVMAICARHRLTVYLHGGTLLGAVMYRGYIPWDDDIDLIMPRGDYERLRTIFTGADAPQGLTYVDEVSDPEYPYPFAKIGMPGTLLVDHGARDMRVPINIDVFPMDGWPGNPVLATLHGALTGLPKRLAELSIGAVLPGWKRPFSLVAKAIVHGLGSNRLARVIAFLAARQRVRPEGSGGLVVWGPNLIIASKAYADPVALEFEGRMLPGPKDPHEVLTVCYGPNYLVVPPLEQQVSHHDFTAFVGGE